MELKPKNKTNESKKSKIRFLKKTKLRTENNKTRRL